MSFQFPENDESSTRVSGVRKTEPEADQGKDRGHDCNPDHEQDEHCNSSAGPGSEQVSLSESQLSVDPLVGTTIGGGRYEILQVLGYGGMSVVYKARQVQVDRIVAVKTLRMQLLTDPLLVQRFDREVKTLSRLGHPNIVTVFDFVVEPGGKPYFIMDFLIGKTLEDLIDELGRISVARAINIFTQVCNAVEYAHRQNIVHRDLKPANIMVLDLGTGQDFIKVVDFGLAKLQEDAQGLTSPGEIWGSPYYMSPEQCSGAPVDARSDIYSMGAVMYETLTGSVPFRGKTFVETITKHVTEPPRRFDEIEPPIEVSPHLQEIVLRALAKNPIARFQSMAELREELQAVLSNRSLPEPEAMQAPRQSSQATASPGGGTAHQAMTELLNSGQPPSHQESSPPAQAQGQYQQHGASASAAPAANSSPQSSSPPSSYTQAHTHESGTGRPQSWTPPPPPSIVSARPKKTSHKNGLAGPVVVGLALALMLFGISCIAWAVYSYIHPGVKPESQASDSLKPRIERADPHQPKEALQEPQSQPSASVDQRDRDSSSIVRDKGSITEERPKEEASPNRQPPSTGAETRSKAAAPVKPEAPTLKSETPEIDTARVKAAAVNHKAKRHYGHKSASHNSNGGDSGDSAVRVPMTDSDIWYSRFNKD